MTECNHIYDEYDLCFECDAKKPKSPNTRKAAERKRKRAAGLVPVEVWIPAEKKSELAQAVNALCKVEL
jgi:hypothetical protein